MQPLPSGGTSIPGSPKTRQGVGSESPRKPSTAQPNGRYDSGYATPSPAQPSRMEISLAALTTTPAISVSRSTGRRKLGPEALTDATTSPSAPKIGPATAVRPGS